MNLDNTLLITHKNCLDGTSSGLLFLQAGGKRENILFVSAGQVSSAIKRYKLLEDPRKLLFCDLGLTDRTNDLEVVEALEKRGNVVLLDHHESSLHLRDRSWCTIDLSRCGARLLREYLKLENYWINEYCLLVDDFDRGLFFKKPYSEDLTTLHSFIGQNSFIDKFTQYGLKHRFEAHLPSWLTSSELELLSYLKRKQIDSLQECLDSVYFRYIELETDQWIKVGYVLSPTTPNYSMLLDEMLKKFNDIKVACAVHVGRGTVSLKSRGDINVSLLAKRFNGGGHTKASGHELNKNTLNEFINGIHDSIESLEFTGK